MRSDLLIIGVDFAPDDIPTISISRQIGTQIQLLNVLTDNDAIYIYEKLTNTTINSYKEENKNE